MVLLGHVSRGKRPKSEVSFKWNHAITRVLRNEPRERWDGARYFGLGKKTEDAKHSETAIVYLNLTTTDFVFVLIEPTQWVV
jgi:hypothetical protein